MTPAILRPEAYTVRLPILSPFQESVRTSLAKRRIVRAGRRIGKTYLAADLAVEYFLEGHRILYAAPTADQLERFWFLVKDFLGNLVEDPAFYKNESEHIVERTGTENRVRAKTAWNADTLRGDYADLLILDEWQLMHEDAWGLVGAPMLLDNDGAAIFIYTPISMRSRHRSKAKDPLHAARMFKKAKAEMELALEAGVLSRWQIFSGSSRENPYISPEALESLAEDMTDVAFRQEILAEDIDEAPFALWKRDIIEKNRVYKMPPLEEMELIVVGVDPNITSINDDAGIIVGGKKDEDYFTLEDASVQGGPDDWGMAVATAFYKYQANYVIAESNQGGDMVAGVIRQVDPNIPVLLVHASRGKYTRAEPVAVTYQKGRVHHVGTFPTLEDEMCMWVPGDPSPNHMDALVWCMTYLQGGAMPQIYGGRA